MLSGGRAPVGCLHHNDNASILTRAQGAASGRPVSGDAGMRNRFTSSDLDRTTAVGVSSHRKKERDARTTVVR